MKTKIIMNRDENDEDDACNDNDNIVILFY